MTGETLAKGFMHPADHAVHIFYSDFYSQKGGDDFCVGQPCTLKTGEYSDCTLPALKDEEGVDDYQRCINMNWEAISDKLVSLAS